MKRIKGYLKRFLACFMIVCALSFTTVGNYLSIQEYQVYATGGEIFALKALIEAIMASMGLAFSSTADLNNAASGLQASMNQYPDYQYQGKSVFSEIKEALKSSKVGEIVTLSNLTVTGLQAYCYSLVTGKLSAASDVVNPSLSIDPGTDAIRLDIASELTMEDFFYGKKVDFFNGECKGFTPDLLASSMIVTVLKPLDAYVMMSVYSYDSSCYILKSCEPDADGVTANYIRISSGELSKGAYIAGYTYYYDSNSWRGSSGGLDGDKEQVGRGSYVRNAYIPASYDASKNYQVRVYLDHDTRIYDSLESYRMLNYSALFAPTAPVYGLSSSAKDFEVDSATGNVSIAVPDYSITESVEKAVGNALAENPSITEEELNAAVSDIIASNNGIEDSIDQNTATLSTLLTSILSIFRVVSDNVTKIAQQAVTDGSSALKLDDIAEQFTVIDGGAEPEEPEEPEKPPEEPKIWKWTPIGFEFLKLFKPLFEFLAEPLSIVTQSLNMIWSSIKEIPGDISAAFQEWVVPQINALKTGLESLGEGLANMPKSIADAVKAIEWPPLEVPEVSVPPLELPVPVDYSSPLARIIELLENMFVIDTVVLADHLKGLENVWSERLPFVGKTQALFSGFGFSDKYDYPVIKIKTPDVLKTFYSDEFIILLDFADYKQYCLWARNIVKAWLWFCFGLSIFNHIKTNLHIG